MKLARDLGRCRGVIDEYCASGNAVKGAICPERDLAQVMVVADAGHDEILTLRRCPWCRRRTPAELRHPLLGLGGGAIVDRDVVAALDLEVTGHRIAHHAEPEKRNLCHEDPPLRPQRPDRPRVLRLSPASKSAAQIGPLGAPPRPPPSTRSGRFA